MSDTFTLDMLRDAMKKLADIPPRPIFASSVNYPRDGFWQFESDGREYVIGHPSLWDSVPSEPATAPLSILTSVQIHNVDAPCAAELRGKIAFCLMTASRRPGEPPEWPRGVEVPSRPLNS